MHRHITREGLALIQHYEGFAARPYLCPAGYLTIGYGHVVREGEDFAQGITREEAEALLRQNVEIAEKAVLRLIQLPLTDGQYDALVSFTFNLGAGALQRSTLRRRVNEGDHAVAVAEFSRWVWAGGRRLAGLAARRKAEAHRYLTPMS